MSFSPAPLQLACACLLAGIAAFYDAKTGLIPNKLIAIGGSAGVCAAVALAMLRHDSHALYPAAFYSLGGAIFCAPLPLALFLTRGLGGGDGKLLIALGAWLGPIAGLEAELQAFCIGAVYLCGVLCYRGVLWQTLAAVSANVLPRSRRAQTRASERATIKFGPIICAGVLVAALLHGSTP